MKLILLALVMVFIGCGSKPEKKVVPVEKHPVLKSKEELKQELIQEIKTEREKR